MFDLNAKGPLFAVHSTQTWIASSSDKTFQTLDAGASMQTEREMANMSSSSPGFAEVCQIVRVRADRARTGATKAISGARRAF